MRRIARWEVYALYLLCLHLTITPTILETPRTSGVPVCIADSRGLLAFSRGLRLFAPTLRMHRRDSITFYSILLMVLHATCSPMTGGEASRWCSRTADRFYVIHALLISHTHGAGRAIPMASLSLLVSYTVIGHIPLPARMNLCLWFGRLSHIESFHLRPVPKRHRCLRRTPGATLRRLTFSMLRLTCPLFTGTS